MFLLASWDHWPARDHTAVYQARAICSTMDGDRRREINGFLWRLRRP
jgi:hypothetical protein